MIDNPQPALETVRGIVEQIASGLRAFHRKEMLHQDIRPDNIMIDSTGTVKIIDFGSTKIPASRGRTSGDPRRHSRHAAIHRAGVFSRRACDLALRPVLARRHHLPDADGKAALWRADRERADAPQFNGLVIPCRRRTQREVPQWIDGTLERAGPSQPLQALRQLSEFLFDLRHPMQTISRHHRTPLIERNPLLFWKCTTIAAGARGHRAARDAAHASVVRAVRCNSISPAVAGVETSKARSWRVGARGSGNSQLEGQAGTLPGRTRPIGR
jgi:serine/threonine protein kinase